MENNLSVLAFSLPFTNVSVWLFALALLLLCGDVESNPGPKPAREPKPDKAKIMADKVDAHDAKLEELEALVKSQAELIEELTKKQVDLVAQLEEKQVDLRKHLEANKVEAETSIVQLKVALESDLRRTSSNLEVKIVDQKVMPPGHLCTMPSTFIFAESIYFSTT
jgi:Skp family chaperone for outer membrane proteins